MAVLLSAVLWYILTLAPADFEDGPLCLCAPKDTVTQLLPAGKRLATARSDQVGRRLACLRFLRSLVAANKYSQLLWLPRALQLLLEKLVKEGNSKEVEQAMHAAVKAATYTPIPAVQAKL